MKRNKQQKPPTIHTRTLTHTHHTPHTTHHTHTHIHIYTSFLLLLHVFLLFPTTTQFSVLIRARSWLGIELLFFDFQNKMLLFCCYLYGFTLPVLLFKALQLQ